MGMKWFFCLFLMVSLFFSCNRKTKQYVLKGRLVNSCDGSPGANQALEIRQRPISSGLGGSTKNKTRITENIVTNANGEFVLVYETNHTRELEITIDSQRYSNIFDLPVENLDLGDIPYKGKSVVYCKIKVNNPYTALDTLVYSELYAYPGIQMIGPFHDTILGLRIINDSYDLKYNRSLKKLEKRSSDISINANYRIKHRNAPPVITYSTITTCNIVPDTFVVTIN